MQTDKSTAHLTDKRADEDMRLVEKYTKPAIEQLLYAWDYRPQHEFYNHHLVHGMQHVLNAAMAAEKLSSEQGALWRYAEYPPQPRYPLRKLFQQTEQAAVDGKAAYHIYADSDLVGPNDPDWDECQRMMHKYLGVVGLRALGKGLESERSISHSPWQKSRKLCVDFAEPAMEAELLRLGFKEGSGSLKHYLLDSTSDVMELLQKSRGSVTALRKGKAVSVNDAHLEILRQAADFTDQRGIYNSWEKKFSSIDETYHYLREVQLQQAQLLRSAAEKTEGFSEGQALPEHAALGELHTELLNQAREKTMEQGTDLVSAYSELCLARADKYAQMPDAADITQQLREHLNHIGKQAIVQGMRSQERAR